MAHMTDEEAERLDELYTKNPPDVDPSRPGFFARQKGMVIILDEPTSSYLKAKATNTKRTPSELVSDMVRRDMAAGE